MVKSKTKEAHIPVTSNDLLDVDNFYLSDYKDPFRLSLIYEFLTVQFNNNHVIYKVRKNLPKLLETGNLDYLYAIFYQESMFQEDTFWKQISHWKKVIYYGEFPHVRHKLKRGRSEKEYREELKEIEACGKMAWKCVDVAVDGFKKCIVPDHYKRRRGRPSKPIDSNIQNDYLRVKTKLNQAGLLIIKNDELIDLRRKILVAFIEKNKINNIKIELSEEEVNKLIYETNSEIAIYLLAKSQKVGITKIKQRVAFEDPRYVEALKAKLSDGRVIKIPRSKYNQAWRKIYQELLDCGEADNNPKFCEKMSTKLKVPREAIEIMQCEAELVDLPIRTPHKRKKSSRKKTKTSS